MKIIFLTLLIGSTTFFFERGGDILNPTKIYIEVRKQSSENNLYTVSIYNNSDSVLCVLSSSFGFYKKDTVDALAVWNREGERLIYKIDYTFNDTKLDPFLPIKSKICILPYQQKIFNIKLPEIKSNMFLNAEYFYSENYNYPKSQKEVKKSLWYKKYFLQSTDVKIP